MKNGVCGVAFDRRDIPMNKFMVTCLESVFHVYDARTQHPSKVCGRKWDVVEVSTHELCSSWRN